MPKKLLDKLHSTDKPGRSEGSEQATGLSCRVRGGTLGVSLEIGGEEETLTPWPEAVQERPRRCYVYAHVDAKGQYFYVGKGTDWRAWDKDDRHPLWVRYVSTGRSTAGRCVCRSSIEGQRHVPRQISILQSTARMLH